MRTKEEIVERVRHVAKSGKDFFGFERADLLTFLPFADAREFLVDAAKEEDWQQSTMDDAAIKQAILEYMPFAWEKANDCRGLSALRSVQHMKAWLWLLGDALGEQLSEIYQFYGKPCLRVICEKYGWDWKQWDDGMWRNEEDGPFSPPPATIEIQMPS